MLILKRMLIASALLFSFAAYAGRADQRKFPHGPDPDLTPGELCDRPDAHRYPEKIPYCNRNVDSSTKWAVIRTYDRELGYEIERTGRMKFKIDHYIPLCMGGSNNEVNIWPQHESVYQRTDPLEGLACEKMSAGVLLQDRAVELIKEAKNDLSRVPEILRYIQSL